MDAHTPDTSFLPPCDGAAVFLDFDGTLVDLAPTPDAIHIPDDLPQILHAVADRAGGALALVSGRAVRDLARWLPDYAGLIVGGHGAEWRRDGTFASRVDLPPDALHMLRNAARAFADTQPALLLEEKPTGLVLHYRAQPDLENTVHDFTGRLALSHPAFEAHPAKMAVEMRPRGVGKDLALADVMDMPGFQGRAPVMMGDDTTDEPAMAWAQAHGGIAIKVGPGDSAAHHRLPDPGAVRALLGHWQ
ncbi:trehalose-phosphatase [uncultured Tateyamaria sp.]|uniref:trehalose-phosphatase n=1 Tax=uncultured Tateyamaria sp. TaxID=455651 RepID=UPI0026392D9E|nr:trehalose-phosphatase [uncultured Tateyamaria sp.]